MTLLARLFVLADRVSEPRTAYAHCDLPCGIYDPSRQGRGRLGQGHHREVQLLER